MENQPSFNFSINFSNKNVTLLQRTKPNNPLYYIQ